MKKLLNLLAFCNMLKITAPWVDEVEPEHYLVHFEKDISISIFKNKYFKILYDEDKDFHTFQKLSTAELMFILNHVSK